MSEKKTGELGGIWITLGAMVIALGMFNVAVAVGRALGMISAGEQALSAFAIIGPFPLAIVFGMLARLDGRHRQGHIVIALGVILPLIGVAASMA